jgi:hypothetical protein
LAFHWLTLLQDLIGLSQFAHLALEFLDAGPLGTRRPRFLASVSACLLVTRTRRLSGEHPSPAAMSRTAAVRLAWLSR